VWDLESLGNLNPEKWKQNGSLAKERQAEAEGVIVLKLGRKYVDIKSLFLGIFLGLSTTVVSADKWPEIAAPDNAKISIVTEDTVFNGVPMKMWEMVASQSKEEVLAFYRKEWEKPAIKGAPGYTEYEFNEWKVISRMEDDYLLTVQVMDVPPGRSMSLIAMSTLPIAKNLPAPGKGFPLLSESNVFNDIKSVDGNKESRTIVAQNKRSVADNIRFYRREFRRKGWVELTQKQEPHEKAGALMFDKKNKELNLSVTRSDKLTSIVAVIVTH
jgi:hypothetical protein